MYENRNLQFLQYIRKYIIEKVVGYSFAMLGEGQIKCIVPYKYCY